MLKEMERLRNPKDWKEVAMRMRNNNHTVVGKPECFKVHYYNLKKRKSMQPSEVFRPRPFKETPTSTAADREAWNRSEHMLGNEIAEAKQLIALFDRLDVLESSRQNPTTQQVRDGIEEGESARRAERRRRIFRAARQAHEDQQLRKNLSTDLVRVGYALEVLTMHFVPWANFSHLPTYDFTEFSEEDFNNRRNGVENPLRDEQLRDAEYDSSSDEESATGVGLD
jgi:hypothetical protein